MLKRTTPDQLALFEPEGREALELMKAQSKRYEAFQAEADMWDACLCPGARDQAQQLALEAFSAWLIFAILLDFEREAGL